jgi:NADH-quinone oxidoreductase subunit G
VRRVIEMLGGPTATFNDALLNNKSEVRNLRGGWVVGGYLSNWAPIDLPTLLNRGFRVVQDILPNALVDRADVVLPAAAWAEKDGTWENYQGKLQHFSAAVAPPEGARREGDVYYRILGRTGLYSAQNVRSEMAGPFAAVTIPAENEPEPAPQFVEL